MTTPRSAPPQADLPTPRTSARRGRWTLRSRIVAMLLGLIAAVAGTMGLVSTLALRGSLLSQIDTRLESANARAARAPDQEALDGFPDFPPFTDGPTSPEADSSGDAGDAQSDGSTPDSSATEPSSNAPLALRIPGQDVGTLNLDVVDGVVNAGYVDNDGTFQRLTDAQSAVLVAAPSDGVPHSLDIEELGSYRVLSTTDDDGNLVVTAVSTADAEATVTRYVAVELGVAGAGLGLAGVAGTVLVRRELRPLNRVAATATRVSELPLDRGEVLLAERVPAADTDPSTEVGQVGAALNRMLGHVEEALAARQESETQVRQFVADASHELRTPLASIRGYAELVRRLPEPVPDPALHAMARVESETKRMTGLVEDMLLLARLDAGRDLDLAEVDLAALAVDAIADAHAAGPDHVWRLDLADDDGTDDPGDDTRGGTSADEDDDATCDTEPGGPAPVVVGDEHRLRQVLVNLMSNARVHTPPGTVVTVSVRTDDEHVTVRVQDDGPGIAEPLVSHLFQRFTRGDASRNRAAGSTGLGLAIVHAVVVAHGGTIEVDGTPGRTAFTITLPAA